MTSSTHFGLYLPNFGPAAKPSNLVKLARLAEEVGWEGLFLWDHIPTEPKFNAFDPWVCLAAVAVNTETIRLGTMVTPLARRRSWKLAKEVVTLDHLSSGRVTLGIGLGVQNEFTSYGEPYRLKETAEKLDESVELLRLLWSGEPVDYKGKFYKVKAHHSPQPVQNRIPIWVAGTWPHRPPLKRAAKHEGVFPLKAGYQEVLKPAEYTEILKLIRQHRGSLDDYDVVFSMYSEGDPGKDDWLKSYALAGVNWFVECLDPWRGGLDELSAIVERGPPQL